MRQITSTTASTLATLGATAAMEQAAVIAVTVDQYWQQEATVYAFADGSTLRVSGTDAEAVTEEGAA